MNEVRPIICNGYHQFEPVYQDEDNPSICTIPYTTDDKAKSQGWRIVEDKKFHPEGRIAWLCENCYTRYEQEKQTEIDYIIKYTSSDMLIDEATKRRDQLIKLNATQNDLQRFDRIFFNE